MVSLMVMVMVMLVLMERGRRSGRREPEASDIGTEAVRGQNGVYQHRLAVDALAIRSPLAEASRDERGKVAEDA